nr:hypothetical protein BaRGS_001792 [Batillaria attramentaria]
MLECRQEVKVKFAADRVNCSAVEYSVMAELIGSAIVDLICNGTGVCECRQNVVGVKCDACLPEHYGLASDNTGGKECEICTSGYYGNAMALTCRGQCECLPNVMGFFCGLCVPDSYNYTSGNGCAMCDCHPEGAVGTSCDLWALVVDAIGAELSGLRNRTMDVWTNYGNLEADAVNTTLSDIEAQIEEAGSSVIRVQNITLALSQLRLQLQQIQSTTNDVSTDLEQLRLDYDAIQQNISSLSGFSGVITIGNDTEIQQLSSQLASLNALVEQFSRRAESAMQVLDVARGTFQIADSIHSNTFLAVYDSNAAELNKTEHLLQEISVQLTELEGILAAVQSEFMAANTSLRSVVQASQAQLGQWMNTRLLLQDIARVTAAVDKMKGAFNDVLEGLIILTKIQTDITTAVNTAANISGISLRPLAEMQQFATSIGSTVVSSQTVAETNAKAATALVTAQNVRAEMEQTLRESQQVLEEVTAIQGNIRDATTILNTVRQTHTATTTLNTTIHTAIGESENTAAQLENLVTNSTGAIQRVQGELAAVSNCLRNRQAESASVASQAEIAVQRSQSALQG